MSSKQRQAKPDQHFSTNKGDLVGIQAEAIVFIANAIGSIAWDLSEMNDTLREIKMQITHRP